MNKGEFTTAFLALTWLAGTLVGGPSLTVPDLTIGAGLQVSASVTLSHPAPEGGLTIEIKASVPGTLLFATNPEKSGEPRLELTLSPGWNKSMPFWVQASDAVGAASYTISATGFETGEAKTDIVPSGVVLMGPAQSPSFMTTPDHAPSKLTLYAVRLDESLRYVEEQLTHQDIRVGIVSSNPAAGRVSPETVSIPPGSSSANAEFTPGPAGETELSLVIPEGCTKPAEDHTIRAIVVEPGISITGNVTLGNKLQLIGTVGLGQPAPDGGVVVTLTSEDPRLLLSADPSDLGKQSLQLEIPEGEISAQYHLQGFASSGRVNYRAEAEGYRSREALVVLAPSGVVVAPKPYGPPDEAELLREEAADQPRGLITNLSGEETVEIRVWTVQLDPETLRSADITVQPLGPGQTLEVELYSTTPEVGKIASPVVIQPGHESALSNFTALAPGATQIGVRTPEGFTKSENSSSVDVMVQSLTP